METRLRLLLLSLGLLALPGCASVRNWVHHRHEVREARDQARDEAARGDEPQEDNAPPPRVVEPEVARRKIRVPRVRSSNLEFGLHYGALSIEDFGTNPAWGVQADYHVTEDFFFEADYGRSTAGKTSFETLSGNIQLLTGPERRFTYYDLALGYNFLPGEAFLGRGIAMTSAFYLLGGIGAVDFAGDKKFTVNFGGGYRIVPSDWFTISISVQDRVFQSNLLGTTKLTNNIEARIGTTVYF